MIDMEKILGENWVKKILELWRIINRKDQNNREKCFNKEFQETDNVREMWKEEILFPRDITHFA